LIVGLSLCFLGSTICLFAPTIEVFWIGRLFQGLGAGSTMTIVTAIFRDLFDGNTLAKYISYSALVSVVFLTISPLLGGHIQLYFGWRPIFGILMLCSLIALLAYSFIVPETNKFQKTDNLHFVKIKSNFITLMTSPIFIGYAACSLLTYGAILSWLTSGPVLLEKVVGITPVQFGWVYALTGIAFAIGAFLNSRYVTKLGIHSMLQIGLFWMLIAGMIASLLAYLGFITTYAIVGPAVLLLFAVSLVFPNTSAGLFQPFPQIAGFVGALFYSLRMLGGALFSATLALLPNHNQLPMGIAIIVSAVLSWVIFSMTVKKTHPLP
jgi:MFS family permease